MAGQTHWSRLVRSDVAAEGLLVETFLHGSVQQALAGVQPVNVGVGVVFQLSSARIYYLAVKHSSRQILQ